MSETNATLSEPEDNCIGLETISPSGSALVPGWVIPSSRQLIVAATATVRSIEATFRSGSDMITVQERLSPAQLNGIAAAELRGVVRPRPTAAQQL
jgi:hypothetical protein